MKIMNIEKTKLELMQLLLQTQKESVLEKIKNIFEQESSTFYNANTANLRNRAQESLQSIERGETRSIHEFKNELDSWKKRKAI